MQKEISAIISERETNHPNELKEKETKEEDYWWMILDGEVFLMTRDEYKDKTQMRRCFRL